MSALRLLLLCGLVLAGLAPSAWGQEVDRTAPVEILTYYGPGQSHVGAVENFRVRINETSARPVVYLWDFGDGTLSQGSLVAHRYQSPGTYPVVVVARNDVGSDTLRASIRILPAPAVAEAPPEASREGRNTPGASRQSTSAERSRRGPPPASTPDPASLYLQGAGGVAAEASGFSWILASGLSAEQLNEPELRYRLQGYRADVIEDRAGLGSPIYRLLLGHFPTIDAAMDARPQLPLEAAHPILYAFSPDAEAAALAWAEQNGHRVPNPESRSTTDDSQAIASTASDPVRAEKTSSETAAAAGSDSASTPSAAMELQQVREAASRVLSREVLLRMGASAAGLLCVGFLWRRRRRVGVGVRRLARGAVSLVRRLRTSDADGNEAMAVDAEAFREVAKAVRLGGGAVGASAPASEPVHSGESEDPRSGEGTVPAAPPPTAAEAGGDTSTTESAPMLPPTHPHLQDGSEAAENPIEILWPDDDPVDDPFAAIDDWADDTVPSSASSETKASSAEKTAPGENRRDRAEDIDGASEGKRDASRR